MVRIAILGTRGIPGRYGGFETFAEELSTRLAGRGYEVTVYCRGGGGPRRGLFRGVRLVNLPAIRTKHAETLSHTLLSALHAALSRYDVIYVCNSANAPICWIPWARRQQTVLNVDGLEWKRRKWGNLARAYYRWAARLAARMPIHLVTDARVIQDYYREQLHRESVYFPYGTDLYERGHGREALESYGLESDHYILYVSRLEPENNALLVVEAYRDLPTELPLVIVGDAPYAASYAEQVKHAADGRVRFLGSVYGDGYHALLANARLYVQATEVGGTHPALVEAMGHRNAIVAHDVPEHREVLGDAGRYFAYRDPDDLRRVFGELIADPALLAELRDRAAKRVADSYSWDAVTSSYARYFDELVRGRSNVAEDRA